MGQGTTTCIGASRRRCDWRGTFYKEGTHTVYRGDPDKRGKHGLQSVQCAFYTADTEKQTSTETKGRDTQNKEMEG